MSKSSTYFAAVQDMALRSLNTINPTVTRENTLLLPVPYSWNNGDVVRPNTHGPFVSLNARDGRTTYQFDRLDAVWLKKKMADKFIASHKAPLFVLVYFMGDHAFASAPLRPVETYKVSMHDGLRIDIKELTHVLTLTDDQERKVLLDSDPEYKARMSGCFERKA